MDEHSNPRARRNRSSVWRVVLSRNVVTLGLVSLLTDLSSEMIYPLLPLFLAGLVPLGQAPVYVGVMEGLAETTASLVKLASGRLSDALGKRRVLVLAGYGLSSFVRPFMALAAAGWHVIGLRFLDRVGKGVRTSARDALITESVPPSVLGRAFSFHRAMDHTGAVLGPLTAIVILLALGAGAHHLTGVGGRPDPAEMYALRWLFGLALLPGLLAVTAVFVGVRDHPRPDARATPTATTGAGHRARATPTATTGAGHRARAAGAAKSASAEPSQATQKSLPRRFYAYVGVVMLFSLCNSSDLFLVFYGLLRFHLGLLGFIGLWIALHLSKVAFSLPGGALSDRLDRTWVLIVGWVIYVAVYAGFAHMTAPWQMWGLLVLYGAYYGLTEGAERALVAAAVGPEQRGTAYGVFHGAVGLAALPASLLFGVFWVSLGPRIAFSLGAGIAALAVLLLTTWRLAAPAPRSEGGDLS